MKPTVVLHDTLDDRRQVHVALLSGLSPARCVQFLDWSLAFARHSLTAEDGRRKLLANASADRAKMSAKIEAAERGDADARILLADEIFGDLAILSHHFSVELLPVIEELERWAKGREITPPATAAANWARRVASFSALRAGSSRTPGSVDSGRLLYSGQN